MRAVVLGRYPQSLTEKALAPKGMQTEGPSKGLLEGSPELPLSLPWPHLSPRARSVSSLQTLIPQSQPSGHESTSWVSHLCASHRKRILLATPTATPLLLLRRGLALPNSSLLSKLPLGPSQALHCSGQVEVLVGPKWSESWESPVRWQA